MAFYSIDGIVPVVDPASFVHPTASVIGDVIIEAGCYIGPGASLRGDLGRLVMKAGGNLQDGCIVHGFPDSDTVLEEDAHIGHGAVVHGATIRRNALIGMNAVIMDGAVVGESAFVAAMAFVKAGFEVPARHLAAGIPAKLLRPLSEQELAWKIAGTREYQELARRCLASLKEVTPLTTAEPNRPRLRVDPNAVIPLYKAKDGG